MRHVQAGLLAMLLAAFMLAGCGGSGDAGGAEPTEESYERELQSTLQALDEAWPTGGPSAAAGSDLPATRAALADAAEQLGEIDPPDELRDEHDRLVAGVRGMSDSVVKLEEAQRIATSDPDRARVLTREFAADESFLEVTKAAADLEAAGIETGL